MGWILAALIGGGAFRFCSQPLPEVHGALRKRPSCTQCWSWPAFSRGDPMGSGGLAMAGSWSRPSSGGRRWWALKIDPIRWLICRLRCRRFKDRAQVIRGNMFHLSLEGADVVTFTSPRRPRISSGISWSGNLKKAPRSFPTGVPFPGGGQPD